MAHARGGGGQSALPGEVPEEMPEEIQGRFETARNLIIGESGKPERTDVTKKQLRVGADQTGRVEVRIRDWYAVR